MYLVFTKKSPFSIFLYSKEDYRKLFSSPEPLGSQGELAYSIPIELASVRCPSFSKIFFSEMNRPIKAKFYVEHPWEGGTKVYINGPGHMTKMAVMPIYGKNL